MDADIEQLVVIIGVVATLAIAYQKAIGPQQTELTQAIIDALQVDSRYRRLVNLAVGIILGVGFTVVAAFWMDKWSIVPAGILAGILASVEAGKVHDDQKAADALMEAGEDAIVDERPTFLSRRPPYTDR